jgi:hypothetical protein
MRFAFWQNYANGVDLPKAMQRVAMTSDAQENSSNNGPRVEMNAACSRVRACNKCATAA